MRNAACHTPPTAQTHVEILISRAIAADYAARQAFPELLRTAEAIDRISYSHVYRVPLDYAERVLRDAQERREDRSLPKGMPKAYTALIDRLEDAVRFAKGIWRDPGHAEALARQQAELARHHVGDRVRWRSPWVDDDRDGKLLTITHGYGVHQLESSDGEYVGGDGKRLSYLMGYGAKDEQGSGCFYSPHELQTLDYKQTHLRLAYSRQG